MTVPGPSYDDLGALYINCTLKRSPVPLTAHPADRDEVRDANTTMELR